MAAPSTSIRFAPALKCGPWFARIIPSNLSASSRSTPALSEAMMSGPMAFILQWNSAHRMPSPRSIRLASSNFCTMRVLSVFTFNSTSSRGFTGTGV